MARTVVVLAPDKFKGSLSAPAVCDAMRTGLRRVLADADIRAFPMADGGDGTLDAILARGGERLAKSAVAADGVTRAMPYGILHEAKGDVAVLEIASIVGITDNAGMSVAVQQRTTRGIGELMRAILDTGVRRFIVGLGGSSTNDAGAGLLAALGARLTNDAGDEIPPLAARLDDITRVSFDELDARVRDCDITVLSDVDNPLTGARGATAVFGPQKGVRTEDIAGLDRAIGTFAKLAERAAVRNAQHANGAGAAGGLGFALMLLGARLERGAEVVADLIGLDDALADAHWLITGEGRTDEQTLAGKAPFVAAQRARARNVPATLIAGAVDPAALARLSSVFAGCFALPDGPMTLDACITRAEALISDRAEQIARVWQAARPARRSSGPD